MSAGPGGGGTPGGPDAGVPAEARTRLASGTFSSDLSVADFAACLEMGMEPVGFVQGFEAMRLTTSWSGTVGWNAAAAPGAYWQRWDCPHGMFMRSNDHRPYGSNTEMTQSEAAWTQGFNRAFARMLDEARAAGAHGVVGVANTLRPRLGGSAHEFHLTGTAVRVPGAGLPETPFTTYLSGQRLVKLLEAGYMPVSIVSTMVAVYVYASCVTVWACEGQGYSYQPGEIDQISTAVQASVDLANARAAAMLGADALHGAGMECTVREGAEADRVVQCILHGSRVRRFRPFDPMEPPRPTVSLSR